jgi:peptidoglycan DL-endopeptidase CwlO
MRARTNTRSDAGQISTTLVITAASLLLTVTIFAGTGGGFDQNPAACQAQPDPTREARNSIPANYLTLYRKTGQDYGIAWNLLAAIGEIESDHGRAPGSGVHSGANHAGAAGPMQIGIGGAATNNWGGTPRHRATTKVGGYGVDGNKDGWADVYDPADAIPAAARFLKAHGAPSDIRAAVFAYNPSTAYVNKVLNQAARYADHSARAIAAPANPSANRPRSAPCPRTASPQPSSPTPTPNSAS